MFYKLDENKQIVPCEPNELMGNEERRVALDVLDNGIRISTVFLAVDHAFREEEPVLFETMVFGTSDNDIDMERYSTWDEAVAGHKAILAKYKADSDFMA